MYIVSNKDTKKQHMEHKETQIKALSFGRDFLSAGKKSPFVGSNPTLRTSKSAFGAF